jgi:predicted enzyme related to lactoylglutathione lyase
MSEVGFVLLASADPERLRRWYRDVVGLELDGSSGIVIDGRDDIAPTNPEPHRLIVNVLVDDAAAVEARLVAGGAVWVRELEPGACGPIGTVVDPDGNYVQFIEPQAEGPEPTGSRGAAPPGRGGAGDHATPDGAEPSLRGGERSTGAGRRRRRRPRPGR